MKERKDVAVGLGYESVCLWKSFSMLVTAINWPRCSLGIEVHQTDLNLIILDDDVNSTSSTLMEKDTNNKAIGQPNTWHLAIYVSISVYIYSFDFSIYIYIDVCVYVCMCRFIYICLYRIGRGNTCSCNKSRSLLGHKAIAFYCNCNCNPIKRYTDTNTNTIHKHIYNDTKTIKTITAFTEACKCQLWKCTHLPNQHLQTTKETIFSGKSDEKKGKQRNITMN